MISLDTLPSDLFFALSNITPSQLIDLGLVTTVFFVVLKLLHRGRATVLLRGTLVLVSFFFIFTVFLPLPTFDYLIQVALIAILVAIPVIFQPELRYLLEELGRGVGNLNWQQRAAGVTLKPLVRAIENLSSNQVGALIVLEGEDDLSGIRETGVPVGSEVTSELLQTIFYDGTPLHDGALIIRADKIVAAGCVLPVSNRQLYADQRRLGTRHRAAVGLTEMSDALVLVVSEETGHVSTARYGQLQSNVDKTVVREQIYSFYQPEETATPEDFSWQRLIGRLKEWWSGDRDVAASRQLLSDAGVLLLSLLLALGTWAFVLDRTDAIQQTTITGIPLQVTGSPPGTRLSTTPPESVTAVVKAGDQLLPSLDASSFTARISLSELSPGLHQLPVDVEPGVGPVQVVGVRPAELELRLEEIITDTVPVEAVTVGEETLSPAYEVRGVLETDPAEVQIAGAASNVEQVAYGLAELSVAEASGTVERVLTVTPVTEDGEPVEGVTVHPEQVQVRAVVARRPNAREVGIRVETQGSLPAGYRLSQFLVSPAQVTLLGAPGDLLALGSAIRTLPVDISNAAGGLRVQVPLDLPAGVEAVNTLGETVRSVLVQLEVNQQMANRVVDRPVEIVGATGVNLAVVPARVDVTLSGAVPLLNDVEAQPALVRVFIDATTLTELEPGESAMVTPQIDIPGTLQARIFPQEVEVIAR